MDPVEKNMQNTRVVTIGDLLSYYYDKYSTVYENEELRNLAVSTTLEDLLSRSQAEER